jgi:hypothetical protein
LLKSAVGISNHSAAFEDVLFMVEVCGRAPDSVVSGESMAGLEGFVQELTEKERSSAASIHIVLGHFAICGRSTG